MDLPRKTKRARRIPRPQAFLPRFHRCWEIATTRGELTIDCKDQRKFAVILRQKLYTLRKSLIAANNDLGFAAELFSISVLHSPSTNHYYLKIERTGLELDAMLKDADIQVKEAPDLTFLHDPDAPPAPMVFDEIPEDAYTNIPLSED